MPRPDLDAYYMQMVDLVASRSTCPRRSVGAVLVDEEGKLVATGYNGQPAGFSHCSEAIPCPGHPEHGGSRDDCEAVHAEANVLLQAAASRRKPVTLYCSLTPCFYCAKLLITASIKTVVCAAVYAHDDRGALLLQKAGVRMRLWTSHQGRTEYPTRRVD